MHHYLGTASQILERWRTELIQCLAHAEAYIDFEEHEVILNHELFSLKNLRKMSNLMFILK